MIKELTIVGADDVTVVLSEEATFYKVAVRVRKYKALNGANGEWNPSECAIELEASQHLREEEVQAISRVLTEAAGRARQLDVFPLEAIKVIQYELAQRKA